MIIGITGRRDTLRYIDVPHSGWFDFKIIERRTDEPIARPSLCLNLSRNWISSGPRRQRFDRDWAGMPEKIKEAIRGLD